MADQTAVYRAVADFSSLKRQADAARRSLRRLRDESSDTHEDYVAGQEEVTEATDDSTKSNVKLQKVLAQVQKQTRDTTQTEGSRVDVLQDTVAAIGKQSSAQRENTRLQVEANRAKEKLTLSETKYQSVAEDAAATDVDRAKALDQVRLSSIAAAAATDRLQESVARLALGGGGAGGRPRGPGIATDVGAFGRAFATVAAGALSTLLLVVPTINTIIAGVVGLVALLTAATVAAAAFAAAFITVGAAMGFAAFKWKALLTSSTDGVSEWKAAVLAIEASAFNAFKGIMSTFEDTGKAGTSMWDSIIEASNTLINAMEPIFQRVADAIYNFTQALAGVPGAASPFLDFLRTWLDEWKKLGEIVNEDILPGGPGFFTKYEAPAKAFVEGIARVINGIRKFSRMGLGLNMDQLAEFITNVFDALAKLIQIIPRYSNALVAVGLATSRWLDALIPIIDAAVKIGEVILKDLVAPLVEFAGWITTHILNLPIISWLTSLAGGFIVAAFAISKLSFGLIHFKDIIAGRWLLSAITAFTTFFKLLRDGPGLVFALQQWFPKLTTVIGGAARAATALGNGLTGLSGLAAGTIGTLAITAVVLGGWFLINKAMDDARKRQEALARASKKTQGILASGAITISEAYQRLAASYQDIQAPVVAPAKAKSLEKLGVDVDKSGEAAEYARVEIAKWGNEISKNAVAGVSATGALTEEQTKYLLLLKDGEGTQQNYRNFLIQVNELYDKGVISTAQYAGVLDQLGVTTNAAGEEVDVLALKVEGASNTIADALIDIGREADLATGGLERFATSMGEDPRQFARDAVAAFNDVQNGLLGTGTAVTDWFRDTVDAIEAWKNEIADSFDIVKQAFIDLGGEADLTWDKFKKGIDDAIEAANDMQDNITYILKHGASPLLEQLIAENGPALASLYEVLREQGPKAIHEANQALREGVDISTGIADSLADAMGVALEPLLKSIELLISKMLGIPFKEVEQQVNSLVDTAEGDLDRIEKRKPARFAVTTPSEIGFEDKLTPAERRARREGRGLRPPGTRNNTPSELRQYPVPETGIDEKAMRTKYETVGRVGVAGGMAAGMAEGTPEVKTASRDLADATVTETNKRLRISSPSKVFIAIGKQVVAGFQEGITDPGGWNSAVGAIVSSLTGLKDTISEMFTNARSWLGGIIEAFKHLYRVIAEDLTPAVGDLQTALENLPDTIDIALDLDTSAAETAANAFVEKMKKKGLIFKTSPTVTQHSGGPAGHGARFATGPPKADEVDARLQKGEFVVSRQGVQNMGGLGQMSEFHNFIQGKRLFHNGGPVSESEDVDARIAKLAQSLGFAGVATAILPKQGQLQPEVSVSAPGAGKAPSGLTAAAANYMAVIKKNFPMVTGYGTIAVRNIAGTSTWSQHAYGNAIDVMTGTSTALRQAVAFFSDQFRRVLRIAHLLADPWFPSPLGDHFGHVHADFNPQYGGTPPGQPYRQGGKVKKRGGRVHENEFVLRDSAARALGDPGLDYLNTHASRYGPAAFLEAFNQSFATSSIPTMGGAGGMEDSGGRALFSIAMHLDGKTVSRSVDVHSREADILLPGR